MNSAGQDDDDADNGATSRQSGAVVIQSGVPRASAHAPGCAQEIRKGLARRALPQASQAARRQYRGQRAVRWACSGHR